MRAPLVARVNFQCAGSICAAERSRWVTFQDGREAEGADEDADDEGGSSQTSETYGVSPMSVGIKPTALLNAETA